MYVEGDLPVVSGNTGNGNGMWSDGWWGIILIALLFGWGGFGGYGGNGAGGVSGALTRGDLCMDMNFNDLQNGVRNVNDAVALGFANLNSTICNQQYDTAQMINAMNIANLQNFNASNIANLQSTNAISSQLASCCCGIERGIERLGCETASNTAAIVQAGNANTQRILDYLCNEKISSLQNAAQSQYIINSLTDKLLPVARPAYITCSPYASAFGYPYATNNGCGCGCGTSIQ